MINQIKKDESMRKGRHTGLGIASIILGIVAVFPFYAFIERPFIFGPLAAISGYVSYFGKRKDDFGLVGLILGIIGIFYAAVILVGLSIMD